LLVNRSIRSPMAEFLAPLVSPLYDPDDEFGLMKAYEAAQLSTHPSTQVGAWINGDSGWNRCVDNDPPSLDKEWAVIHAETDALLKSDYTYGGTLYAPWACCLHCATDILAAGIQTVVVHFERMLMTPRKWETEVISGLRMLRRNEVFIRAVSTRFGMTIRVDGQEVEV